MKKPFPGAHKGLPVPYALVAAGFSLRSHKGCGYRFYLPIKLEPHWPREQRPRTAVLQSRHIRGDANKNGRSIG
jgi:hypothetical protein